MAFLMNCEERARGRERWSWRHEGQSEPIIVPSQKDILPTSLRVLFSPLLSSFSSLLSSPSISFFLSLLVPLIAVLLIDYSRSPNSCKAASPWLFVTERAAPLCLWSRVVVTRRLFAGPLRAARLGPAMPLFSDLLGLRRGMALIRFRNGEPSRSPFRSPLNSHLLQKELL